MNDLEAALRNTLRHNLDPIDASPHRLEEVVTKARSRRFFSMLGLLTATALLATATVWTTSELSSSPSPPPAGPAPSGSPQENGTDSTRELVVGTIEETQGDVVSQIALRAIDLDTGKSRNLEITDFSPGDAQFALVQTGAGLVFRCNSGACALDGDLQGETRVLGKAECFSPSATEGRVWLALQDPDSPATVGSMKSVQEISLDGQVAVNSDLPPDRWHCPVGAVNQGVVFQEGNGLVVWDAEAREIVFRVPGPFSADTQGDLVAWCDYNCKGGLHITNIANGEDTVVEDAVVEDDQLFQFEETYNGAFSPDGSLLAVPVATGPSGHPRQVALIDVQEGTARLIANLSIRGSMTWASTENRLFINIGEGRIGVYDAGSDDLREVSVDVSDIFAMAAS